MDCQSQAMAVTGCLRMVAAVSWQFEESQTGTKVYIHVLLPMLLEKILVLLTWGCLKVRADIFYFHVTIKYLQYYFCKGMTWFSVCRQFLSPHGSLCLNFVHLLARKPNLEKKNLFIQTNSFIFFTCPNPMSLVPGFGQMGLHEDCYGQV